MSKNLILNDLNELKSRLWNISCKLRGNMDAFEFKDYILTILCFRFLSEQLEIFLKRPEVCGDNINQEKYIKNYQENYNDKKFQIILQQQVGFYLKPEELWSSLIKQIEEKKFSYITLQNALYSIENTSKNNASYNKVFKDLFSSIDLNNNKIGNSEKEKNNFLSTVILEINNICSLNSYKDEMLGDIYEYLIGQFAASAGKKSGEFFTPSSVSKLISKITTSDQNIFDINSKISKNFKIYDPTCGSGSLLLKVIAEIENNKHASKEKIEIYGQELNNTTYNLARMNMLLHSIDIPNIYLEQGNTLTDPSPNHKEQMKKNNGFEIVVANPPYSQHWCLNASEEHYVKLDERFSDVNALAPKNKADWAFVQHMIYYLSEDGICAVVLPHGVLFRGNSELLIRKNLIDKGYLSAVIGLPSNIFYGTSIPTCILIFKKCKQDDNILFIDASSEFESYNKKNILSDVNISKILEAYKQRVNKDKFAYLASLEEIQENDYNLNISRYIPNFENEPELDIKEIVNNIKETENKKREIDQKINEYLKELNIKFE